MVRAVGDVRRKTCQRGHSELRRINAALLAGVSVDVLSKKWGLSTSSLKRHRLSHIDRTIRRPDRVDEDRDAADMLVGMADRLADLDRIAATAIEHGHSLASVRATTEARQVSKLLFADLGLDSTSVATWLRDAEALFRAVQAWAKESPAVLTILAEHLDDDDRHVARELRQAHDLLVAARQRATELETADAH